MTQATVEKLVEAANQLAQRGSWIRSGLTKWLEMWKEATATDLKDSRLQRVVIWDRPMPVDSTVTYYLQRGQWNVYFLWDEYFEGGRWDKEEVIDVADADMDTLRHVIRRLAEGVDKYIGELPKACEEYDKLIMLLPPEDHDPVMLTADYWALPKPAPEGPGWVADIIDVESIVFDTTPIVESRNGAIKVARGMAHKMEGE